MQLTEPNLLFRTWFENQQLVLGLPSEDYATWFARAMIASLQAAEIHLGRPTASYEQWFNETIGTTLTKLADNSDRMIELVGKLSSCVVDEQLAITTKETLKVEVENKVPVTVENTPRVHVDNEVDVTVKNEALRVRNYMLKLEDIEFPEPLFVLGAEKDIEGHPKKFECEVINEPTVKLAGGTSIDTNVVNTVDCNIVNEPIVRLSDDSHVDAVVTGTVNCNVLNEPTVHLAANSRVDAFVGNTVFTSVVALPEVHVGSLPGVDVIALPPVSLSANPLPVTVTGGTLTIDQPVSVIAEVPLEVYMSNEVAVKVIEVEGTVDVAVKNRFSDPIPVCQLTRTLVPAPPATNNYSGQGVFRELSQSHPLPMYQVGPDNGTSHTMGPQNTTFVRDVSEDGYVWSDCQNSRLPDVYKHEFEGEDRRRTVLAVVAEAHS